MSPRPKFHVACFVMENFLTFGRKHKTSANCSSQSNKITRMPGGAAITKGTIRVFY